MSELIDLAVCGAAMERAVMLSLDSTAQSDPQFAIWEKRARGFSELAASHRLKTYPAMLGTALLAKAANPRIDPFSLKASDDSPGAYDARYPSENVLVPASHKHRFSLGVTGPQPLNNQPFFREYRISNAMKTAKRARPVLAELLTVLHEINQLRADEATLALAAFVHVRRDYVRKYEAAKGAFAIVSIHELVRAIATLVSDASEGGRRAQASVGGVADSVFGQSNVRVGKPNEPDTTAPGDVAVRAADGVSFERVFEVRDKNVPTHAALSLIEKISAAGVKKAVLVAVSSDQEPLQQQALHDRALDAGISLQVFTDWRGYLDASLFASRHAERETVETAIVSIRARLIEVEASPQAVHTWDELTLHSEPSAT